MGLTAKMGENGQIRSKTEAQMIKSDGIQLSPIMMIVDIKASGDKAFQRVNIIRKIKKLIQIKKPKL